MIQSFEYNGRHIRFQFNADRLNKNFKRAQYWLDTQIFLDCMPKMPFVSGVFRNTTQAHAMSMAGSGLVEVGTSPMGQFLYYGKVMVDPVTGSPWARKGAKKVVTNRDLTFQSGEAFWFEKAKKEHVDEWINGVKKILNED